MKTNICLLLTTLLILLLGCEKEKTIPEVSTSPEISVTDTAIYTGGTVNDKGASDVIKRGVCWDTLPNPILSKLKTENGKGLGSFTSVIKNFLPNTKYYVRAYAYNINGTGYGNNITFVTNKAIPVVSTGKATLVTSQTANISGSIIHNGGESVISYGICWSTSPSPTVSTNKIAYTTVNKQFECNLTGLTYYTKYYVRAFAENSLGISYGSEISFVTRTEITVTDYDGNVYNTCTIGTRLFMMENLKVLHYRNGEAIPNVTNGLNWYNLNTGAYCFYNNDTANNKIYGPLYNWYAVSDSRGLAPAGWHVITDSEWNALYTYLGGNTSAVGKMKMKGDNFSSDFNNNATNESNFSIVPNGMRVDDNTGLFQGLNGGAYFWTANPCISCSDGNYAHSIWLSVSCYFYVDDKRRGFAVRCIKD